MRRKGNGFLMFLIGLFSMTEVNIIGYIGISELFIFLLAPFVFLTDYSKLRHDGFLPFIWLVFLTLGGCVIATLANHTPFPSFARGFSGIYSIFASVVCLHRLIRRDFLSIRWIVLGYAFSMVLNVFAFQKGTSRAAGDTAFISAAAMQGALSYVLFWTERIKNFLYAPIQGWYEKMPKWYAIPASFAVVLMGLFWSGGSGRSVAVCALITSALLFIGSKKQSGLLFLKKHFILLCFVMVGVVLGARFGYSALAKSGRLGEDAYKKYERQTRRGGDLLSLLMGGRIEFFVGIYASLQHPFVGYGPWALDYEGLYGEFLSKYGTEDDYERHLGSYNVRNGLLGLIPAHSWIVTFWLWYGITGLLLWLYVLWLVGRVFTRWLHVCPSWYGYLVCTMPLFLWNLFFSPFGARVLNSCAIVVCLFIRAVAQKKLPPGGVT